MLCHFWVDSYLWMCMMNADASKYLWFILLKLNTCKEDDRIIWLHQEEVVFAECKPQEMSQLTGHCAWSFPWGYTVLFRTEASLLGIWSLQKETELSSHMIPFLITHPIHWQLEFQWHFWLITSLIKYSLSAQLCEFFYT